ncbi:MAG: hypothetical protein J6R33_01275 [Clostridia bacterium]|nr:hypothetical protein [Clostridia bacterium]
MKIKQITAVILLLVLLLAGLPVSAAERKLTLDRAVQISSTQIILEFSEPISIGKMTEGRKPAMLLRIVNSSGVLQTITDTKSKNYKANLQWEGTIRYTDSKHDRVVWTLDDDNLGIKSISDVTEFKGELESFNKQKVAFVIEEIPVDGSSLSTDNTMCNITTQDGLVYLTPTLPNGREKCILPLEVNLGYRVNLSNTESTEELVDSMTNFTAPLIALGDGNFHQAQTEDAQPVRELRNNPMLVAGILGGGAVVLVALLVVSFIILKKKKKV